MWTETEIDRHRVIELVVSRSAGDPDGVSAVVDATLRCLREPNDDLEQFYACVRARAEVPIGFAVEHAQLTLEAAAEQLPNELRALITRDLPPALAALFHPRKRSRGIHPPGTTGRGHTLAAGKPGSRHPLSEAHPDRTQQHSVAATDAPHSDSAVSVTHGSKKSQSLADGRPGSTRPLVEKREG